MIPTSNVAAPRPLCKMDRVDSPCKSLQCKVIRCPLKCPPYNRRVDSSGSPLQPPSISPTRRQSTAALRAAVDSRLESRRASGGWGEEDRVKRQPNRVARRGRQIFSQQKYCQRDGCVVQGSVMSYANRRVGRGRWAAIAHSRIPTSTSESTGHIGGQRCIVWWQDKNFYLMARSVTERQRGWVSGRGILSAHRPLYNTRSDRRNAGASPAAPVINTQASEECGHISDTSDGRYLWQDRQRKE